MLCGCGRWGPGPSAPTCGCSDDRCKIAAVRALVIACLVCVATVAAADDRPWAQGVSDEDQKAALKLYEDGNKHFEESEYKEALEQYDLALEKWKHPAIYFNAAVCLYNLSQYLKAADYIDKALAYGDAPFDKKTLKQVNDYKTLVSAHVTFLNVKCKQTDVRITLDGQVLMTKCPTTERRRLEVEKEHAIVGEKPGYDVQKIGPIHLSPGDEQTITIDLHPTGKGRLVRRWNRAVPWYVIGAGVVVAGAGALEMHIGNELIRNYNNDFHNYCTAGCSVNPSFGWRKDGGALRFEIGQGLAIGGGVVAAAGVAMIWLNQPRLEKAPQVAPNIGPDHAGVVVFGRW